VFAGARYFHAEATLDWRLGAAINRPGGGRSLTATGRIEQDESIVDGIVGVRGEIALGEGAWSLPFHLDVGTGTSDVTWQAMAGVAYGFGKWDLIGVYRHLAYDLDDDALLKDFSFSGPAIAARFRF